MKRHNYVINYTSFYIFQSETVVDRLRSDHVPLTVCPLSNKKLQVNARYFSGRNVTKELLDKALNVTINSDDPAYFGGYITDNFIEAANETGMTEKDIYQICKNSFNATFLPLIEKEHYLRLLHQFNINYGYSAPQKSVTVFGSRSTKPDSPMYQIIRGLCSRFSRNGYRVVNGGYHGSMGAATQGATDENGPSLGVVCPRIFTYRPPRGNEKLTHVNIGRHLCDRITRMLDASEYIFIFPGTLGTFTELAVTWNTAMFRRIQKRSLIRIFLFRDPYAKIISDINDSLHFMEEDLQLLTYFDDIDEVFKIVESDRKKREEMATLKQ